MPNADSTSLRVDLINGQFDLRTTDRSVIVLLAGDDRDGCEEVVDHIREWMDARYIDTHFYGPPTSGELERPRFWRYWVNLAPRGRLMLLFGAWAMNAISDRIEGLDDADYGRRIDHICNIERALAADGAVILKLWIQRPPADRKGKKKRNKHRNRDPDWPALDDADRDLEVVDAFLEATALPEALWFTIDGADDHARDVAVMRHIRGAIARALTPIADPEGVASVESVGPAAAIPDALAAVDLGCTLDAPDYDERLEKLQKRLLKLQGKARRKGVSTILVFEGWDAAGKGGAIRRITHPLSARDVRVIPIGAPSEEERARHYLWRFWRPLPPAGNVLIFDRSWYGRVLVERVEGYASVGAWRRAYDEINDFEAQIVEHGTVLLKFWLHIDPDEQMRRFRAREQTDYKKYKITEDDYRNRKKWPAYVAAANEMIHRTSVDGRPWTLVPANCKRYARVTALETICDALADAV